MSESPQRDNANQVTRYQQGWKALNRLLREDRSFSGHEKNCAYLNMRNGQFASVSSVSGLDFSDDSRGIALCDWDFDGKQDFWITARTSPRVRLVHNESKTKGRFLALRLQGDGRATNRQAVGARVEVVLSDGVQLIRTLHAGDAFLSQSSDWLHFGLGESAEIKTVQIRWPGQSQSEVVKGCRANGFYQVQQGSGTATAWNPPKSRKSLVATQQKVKPSTERARIVSASRLPLPYVRGKTSPDAESRQFQFNGPTLVNVWSATCANCRAELSEWTKSAAKLKDASLNIVTLCADTDDETIRDGVNLLEELKFPFVSVIADPESIRSIDYFQRALLDRWKSIPVPCSLLLDEKGQVVVIYKGPVKTQQLVDDMQLLSAETMDVQLAAVPFPGRWYEELAAADPKRVSSLMIDHAQLDAAADYLSYYVQRNSDSISPVALADTLFIQSVLKETQKDYAGAIESLEKIVELNPNDFRFRASLARLYDATGQFDQATPQYLAAAKINGKDVHLQRKLVLNLLRQERNDEAKTRILDMLKKTPRDPGLLFQHATVARKLSDWPTAIASYRKVYEIEPRMVLAANNLSWVLATHPDEKLRNEKESLTLAREICQRTKNQQPLLLDTLAVAQAANGDFDGAVKTCQRALKIIRASGKGETDSIEKRIELFRQKKPFRESYSE